MERGATAPGSKGRSIQTTGYAVEIAPGQGYAIGGCRAIFETIYHAAVEASSEMAEKDGHPHQIILQSPPRLHFQDGAARRPLPKLRGKRLLVLLSLLVLEQRYV